jgi:hypothetical protein
MDIKPEDKKDDKHVKDENGLYKTRPVFKSVENLIARTTWISYFFVRFVFRLTWNIIKLSWQALKEHKSQKQSEVVHAPQAAAQQLAGSIMATQIAAIDQRFFPAQALKTVHEDEWSLSLRLFPDRIERTLKTESERMPWMRSAIAYKRTPLVPVTREMAEQAKVQFTFDGAVVLTKKEFMGQKFPKPSKVAIEDAKPSISMPAIPVEPASPDEPQPQSVEYIGQVVSAGVVEIQPQSGKSYNTFLVALITKNGDRHELSGVDLREKFQRREFGVNDIVRILKKTTAYRKGEEKRKKNTFEIQILEQAAI